MNRANALSIEKFSDYWNAGRAMRNAISDEERRNIFAAQSPEIQRMLSDDWHGVARISSLLAKMRDSYNG
jgi:hypothetical protein